MKKIIRTFIKINKFGHYSKDFQMYYYYILEIIIIVLI